MPVWERIFHALLFEIILIILLVLGLSLLTSHGAASLFGMNVVLALMAMVWNVVFNWGFDKIFTGEKINRSFGLRLFHVILFEGGLIFFTVPVIAFLLDIGWWAALTMDIGMTIFVTFYAFVYNWSYDHIRAAVMRKRKLELIAKVRSK